MSDMSLANALNEAKKVVNFYRSFQHIEAVLEAAVLAEKSLADLIDKKKKLDTDYKKQLSIFKDLQSRTESEQRSAKDGLNQLKKSISKETREVRGRYNAAMASINDEMNKAEKTAKEREGRIKERIANLQSEESKLKSSVASLNKSLENLRKRVDKAVG